MEERINRLLEIFLNTSDEEDAEVYYHFIEKGEDPEEIVRRAAECVYRKEEEMKGKGETERVVSKKY